MLMCTTDHFWHQGCVHHAAKKAELEVATQKKREEDAAKSYF